MCGVCALPLRPTQVRSIQYNLKDPSNPDLRRRVLTGQIDPQVGFSVIMSLPLTRSLSFSDQGPPLKMGDGVRQTLSCSCRPCRVPSCFSYTLFTQHTHTHIYTPYIPQLLLHSASQQHPSAAAAATHNRSWST